jgi:hypothetical protein
MRGESEPKGSWKTICMSLRSGRIALPGEPSSLAHEAMRPFGRDEAQQARPSVVLPEPDSPTTPSVSPLPHFRRDAVDRLDVPTGAAQEAALDGEPDLEILRLDASPPGARREGAPGCPSARRRAACRCRHAAGGEETSAVGRPSTILPFCITQTCRRCLRTMPRSWVMNSIAMPSSACSAFSSLRICACTVTSSAVVGSSAISSRARWRAPWRSSRAGAGRPKAGADRRRAASSGSGMPTSVEQFDDALRARAAPVRPRCRSRISPICRSTVCSGLSEVIGSWKIIEMSLPRTRAGHRLVMVEQVLALEEDFALG